MEDVLEIVDFILSKGSYTPKQVQKILYYAYSLYLVKYNDEENLERNELNKLFNEQIQAWEHGPVVPNFYNYLRSYGKSNTPLKVVKDSKLKDKKNENFMLKILAVLGKYSGGELEKMTHSEKPWINAYKPSPGSKICTEPITDKSIYNYFKNEYFNEVNV